MLKDLQKALNFSKDGDFANELGITKQTLSNWKKRNTFDAELIYTNCLHVNPSWLLSGQGEILKSDNKPDELKGQGIPLIPIDAIAGYGKGEITITENDITKRFVIPEWSDKQVDFLIRISGSSMYPKYSNGDLVACRRVSDISFFQWGKIYVLDTDQGPMVKRLFEGSSADCLKCVSDNTEHYPPFEICKNSVYNYSVVVGVIRSE